LLYKISFEKSGNYLLAKNKQLYKIPTNLLLISII